VDHGDGSGCLCLVGVCAMINIEPTITRKITFTWDPATPPSANEQKAIDHLAQSIEDTLFEEVEEELRKQT